MDLHVYTKRVESPFLEIAIVLEKDNVPSLWPLITGKKGIFFLA